MGCVEATLWPATNSSGVNEQFTIYCNAFPEEVRARLELLRATIAAAAPEATFTFGYGIPTFKLHGNLVHFGAFKGHLGFYPGPAALQAFAAALAGYRGAKGSVQFPHDQPLPLETVQAMVVWRVAENVAKAARKKGNRPLRKG